VVDVVVDEEAAAEAAAAAAVAAEKAAVAAVNAGRLTPARPRLVVLVVLGGHCPPPYPTRYGPSSLEMNDTL